MEEPEPTVDVVEKFRKIKQTMREGTPEQRAEMMRRARAASRVVLEAKDRGEL